MPYIPCFSLASRASQNAQINWLVFFDSVIMLTSRTPTPRNTALLSRLWAPSKFTRIPNRTQNITPSYPTFYISDQLNTTPCPRKKQATLIFDNFAICWDIFFTIFEAPCSGLIAGCCNLLHTHHQCEAFTWCDVTHDVIQAVARRAHRHQISYHLWTHRT